MTTQEPYPVQGDANVNNTTSSIPKTTMPNPRFSKPNNDDNNNKKKNNKEGTIDTLLVTITKFVD